MKTAWFIINRSDNVKLKPYSHQYLCFAEDEAMRTYMEKALLPAKGTIQELGSIVTDIGFVNFFTQGPVDIQLVRLEVKQ